MPLKRLLALLLSAALLLPALYACSEQTEESGDVSRSAGTDADARAEKGFFQCTKYKAGMYKVGKDIPAGEYFLVINSQSTAYLSLSSDSSGSLDSIITNDNFGIFRYIQVADGQYLEVKRADIYLVDEKLPPITEVLEMGDAYMPGMYKVGRDIPAGEYQIIPDSGSSAYYAVLSSSIDSIDSIITNGNTEAAKYITVKEGQYLEVNRGEFK